VLRHHCHISQLSPHTTLKEKVHIYVSNKTFKHYYQFDILPMIYLIRISLYTVFQFPESSINQTPALKITDVVMVRKFNFLRGMIPHLLLDMRILSQLIKDKKQSVRSSLKSRKQKKYGICNYLPSCQP